MTPARARVRTRGYERVESRSIVPETRPEKGILRPAPASSPVMPKVEDLK